MSKQYTNYASFNWKNKGKLSKCNRYTKKDKYIESRYGWLKNVLNNLWSERRIQNGVVLTCTRRLLNTL